MAKGFSRTHGKGDPIVNAANLLVHVAGRLQKPLVLIMHPPGNDHNLSPGQMAGSQDYEVRPSCQGVVLAIASDAEQVQSLIDLVMAWRNTQKEGDR